MNFERNCQNKLNIAPEPCKTNPMNNIGRDHSCVDKERRPAGPNAPCISNTAMNFKGNCQNIHNKATDPCKTNSMNNAEKDRSCISNKGRSTRANSPCDANTFMNFERNCQNKLNIAPEPCKTNPMNNIGRDHSCVDKERRPAGPNAPCISNTAMNFKGNCQNIHNKATDPCKTNSMNNAEKDRPCVSNKGRSTRANSPCDANTLMNLKGNCQNTNNTASDPCKTNSINSTGRDHSIVPKERCPPRPNSSCDATTSMNYERNCQNSYNTASEPCKRNSINNTGNDRSCVSKEKRSTGPNTPCNTNTYMNFKRNCQNTHSTAPEPCKRNSMNNAEKDRPCVSNKGRSTRANSPCDANTSMNLKGNCQNTNNTASDPCKTNSINNTGRNHSIVPKERCPPRPNSSCAANTSMNYERNCQNRYNTAPEPCKRNSMNNAEKDRSCVSNKGRSTRANSPCDANTSMNLKGNCQNTNNTASDPCKTNSINSTGKDHSIVPKERCPPRPNSSCGANIPMNYERNCQNRYNTASEPCKRNSINNTGNDRSCVSKEERSTGPNTPCNTNTYVNFKRNCQNTHNTAPEPCKRNPMNNAEKDRSCISNKGGPFRANSPCDANTSMNFKRNCQSRHNTAPEPCKRNLINNTGRDQLCVDKERRPPRPNAPCIANISMNFKGNCQNTHNTASEPCKTNSMNNAEKDRLCVSNKGRPTRANSPCDANTFMNFERNCQNRLNTAPEPCKKNSMNNTGREHSIVAKERCPTRPNAPCIASTSMNFKGNCQNTHNTASELCKTISMNNSEKDRSCVSNEGRRTRPNAPCIARTSTNFKENCENTHNTAPEPCKTNPMNNAEKDRSCISNKGGLTRSTSPCDANTSMNFERNCQNRHSTAPEPCKRNLMNNVEKYRSFIGNEGRFFRANSPHNANTSMNYKKICQNKHNTVPEPCKGNLMNNVVKDNSCVGNEGPPSRPNTPCNANTSMNYKGNYQNIYNTDTEPCKRNPMNNAGKDRSRVGNEARPFRANSPCTANASMNYKGNYQSSLNTAVEPFHCSSRNSTGKDLSCVSNERRATRSNSPCNTNASVNSSASEPCKRSLINRREKDGSCMNEGRPFRANSPCNDNITRNTAVQSFNCNSRNSTGRDRSCGSNEGRPTRPNTPCDANASMNYKGNGPCERSLINRIEKDRSCVSNEGRPFRANSPCNANISMNYKGNFQGTQNRTSSPCNRCSRNNTANDRLNISNKKSSVWYRRS
ncbi:putative uncharacterized protein DDB_G0282133 isoform X2 [Teleopsis dalmanni]|uniref:putative uncharacterized protein DDB_G0282133 isoform X2 n=1 Tax=Teleopsis dalmanni TaxID=139649 RepID=UPI0018CD6289|nr:putative uncharacterized protein DDB_G0282133 isoform X2 [Teleopsis dalmanni]